MANLLVGPIEPRIHPLLREALAVLGPDCKPLFLGGGAEMLQQLGRHDGDLLFLDLDISGSEECLAEVARRRLAIPVIGVGNRNEPDVAGFEARFPASYFPMMTYMKKPLDLETIVVALQGEIRQLARGVIEGLSLPSLLQVLNMERKTCTIRVLSGRRVGFFYMQGGELINARYRQLEGLEAALRLLASDSPRAEIQSQLHDATRLIEKRLEEVLMEAMQVRDEDTDHRAAQLEVQDEAGEDALPESETGKWEFDSAKGRASASGKKRFLVPVLAACALLGVVALAAIPFRKTTLRLQSMPVGASLSLDGRFVGRTPVVLNLPKPVRGTLRAEAEGYQPLVRALNDGDRELHLVLEPIPKVPEPVIAAAPESAPEPEPKPEPVAAEPRVSRVRTKRKSPKKTATPMVQGNRRGDVFDQLR